MPKKTCVVFCAVYGNPKPDLHDINAHTKFDENLCIDNYCSYRPETTCGGQIT